MGLLDRVMDMVFFPNTGSVVVRSSQGHFFFFAGPGPQKVIFCICLKMKETRTEIWRRSVQVSRRNVCSGPFGDQKRFQDFGTRNVTLVSV